MTWTQPPGQHLTDIKAVGFDQIVLQLENPPSAEYPWAGGGRRIIEVTVYGFSSEEKQENRNTLIRLLSRALETFKKDPPPDDGGTAVVSPVAEPPSSPPPAKETVEAPSRETFTVIDPILLVEEARLIAALKGDE